MKELTREDIVNAANEMRFFEKMRFMNYLAKLIDCKKSGLMAGLASSMVLDEAREDFIKNKLSRKTYHMLKDFSTMKADEINAIFK